MLLFIKQTRTKFKKNLAEFIYQHQYFYVGTHTLWLLNVITSLCLCIERRKSIYFQHLKTSKQEEEEGNVFFFFSFSWFEFRQSAIFVQLNVIIMIQSIQNRFKTHQNTLQPHRYFALCEIYACVWVRETWILLFYFYLLLSVSFMFNANPNITMYIYKAFE